MRWKRWLLASSLVVVVLTVLGLRHYLPGMVATALRGELAAQGFPDAHLEVASIGLRHISLRAVSLGDGLALGDVELDAGISLLWHHAVRTVTLKGAHVTAGGLARVMRVDAVQPELPFDHLRIDDGVIAAAGTDIQVSGTITPAAPAPLALHLEVHAAKLVLGAITAHDVVASGSTAADGVLHGEAHAARIEVTAGDTPVELRDVRVPVELAALAMPRELRWRAAEARVVGAVVRAPSGTFVAQRTLTWRAARARWQGADIVHPSGTSDLARRVHRIAWTTINAGPFELGAGALTLRTRGDAVTIERGHLRAEGGDLVLDPVVTRRHRPTDVMVHVRGLSLAELLQTIGRGRISGTGIVDGHLALRLDAHGLAVTGGALHARGHGGIQVRDPEWLARAAASGTGVALHDRIAAALGDFEYSKLDAAIDPTAGGPDLQLRTRGKGKRVSQTLDLTVNVRGVGAAARWAGLRTR